MGYFGDTIVNAAPSGSDWGVNVRLIATASSPIATELIGRHADGSTTSVAIDENDYLRVSIGEPRSTFGEIVTSDNVPLIQADFSYGFSSSSLLKFEVDVPTNAGIITSGSLLGMRCGTASGSIFSVRSRRQIKYRPGQGALARFTTIFSTPQSGSAMAAGVGDQENSYFFTQLGADFGGGVYIGWKNGARREISRLTLSTASSTNQNLTITLAGSGTLVTVTNSANLIKTANEIAAGDYNSYLGGWDAYSSGSTVTFLARVAKYNSTSYGITASTATGTFAILQSGRSVSTTLISQSAWNSDKMDGTGTSGMILDPSKGNVYQIRYGYLGFIGADFFIQDDSTADAIRVHRILSLNNRTQPTLENPSLPIFWSSTNYANVAQGNTIWAGSCGGFIQGVNKRLGPKRSFAFSKTGVGTTYTSILSIRTPLMFNNVTNKIELFIRGISAAVDGSKPCDIILLRNATLGGIPAWSSIDTTSAVEYDIAGTTITGGIPLYTFALAKAGNAIIGLSEYDIYLVPGEILTVAGKTDSTTSDINASIAWVEEW